MKAIEYAEELAQATYEVERLLKDPGAHEALAYILKRGTEPADMRIEGVVASMRALRRALSDFTEAAESMEVDD